MKNKKIIEIINKLGAQNVNTIDTEEINIKETIIALVNGFCYVKSGRDTERFFQEFERIRTMTDEECEQFYIKNRDKYSFKKHFQTIVASKARELIHDSFDKEFFESQVCRMSYDKRARKELLKQYLNKYTKSQLKDFIRILIELKDEIPYYLFEPKNYYYMKATFNNLVRENDESVPGMLQNYIEFRILQERNPYYFVDYLSEEVLVDVLMYYSLKSNLPLILYIAKALSVLQSDEAWIYTKIVIYCIEVLGIDLFEKRQK